MDCRKLDIFLGSVPKRGDYFVKRSTHVLRFDIERRHISQFSHRITDVFSRAMIHVHKLQRAGIENINFIVRPINDLAKRI